MFSEHEMLIQEWLEALNSQGKSAHTLAAYRRALNHFLRWYKAGYTPAFIPDAVLPRHVWDWKAYQQTVEKSAPATINQRLVAITGFFHWAAAQGLARKNPAEDIGSVQRPTPQPRGVDGERLRLLLDAAREHARDYALLNVMSGAGLRVGELLSLRVGDLSLGERSGSMAVRKRGSARNVPLTADVRRALYAYMEGHRERNNPNAPLWMGARGPLRHRSAVLRLLEKYAIQAGIEPVSPDALRHTFAARYLDANPNDLRGLARILGHSSLNMVIMYRDEGSDDLTVRMERIEAWDVVEASLELEQENHDDDTTP
jgi:site-specific recombinase XerD